MCRGLIKKKRFSLDIQLLAVIIYREPKIWVTLLMYPPNHKLALYFAGVEKLGYLTSLISLEFAGSNPAPGIRGTEFVSLSACEFKSHQGLALVADW